MSFPLLAASQNEEDLKLLRVAALGNSVQFIETTDIVAIKRIVEQNPNIVVLWDYETFGKNQDFLFLLNKMGRPAKNIVVANEPFASHPELTEQPFLGTYIQRRYPDPAPKFYTHLMGAILESRPEGLGSYFADGTKINRIELKQSSHKGKAIEAMQNVLTSRGVQGRLATLIAQSVDELIMNAIFDAPYLPQEKRRYRHRDARDKDFELHAHEAVSVEMASSAEYMGICVTDPFGSMVRGTVLSTLRTYFTNKAENDVFLGPSSGFGLNGVLQSGISLRLRCHVGKKTEAMIFFPIVGSFREFRTGFRFFSLVIDR